MLRQILEINTQGKVTENIHSDWATLMCMSSVTRTKHSEEPTEKSTKMMLVMLETCLTQEQGQRNDFSIKGDYDSYSFIQLN